MSRVILTYADYSALPDDGRRYELHDGELSVTPLPGLRHQLVKGNLFDLLRHHVKEGGLGVLLDALFDCILSDITVIQPDILYVAAAESWRVSERGVEGAPTLAIEVLSPSTERIDRRRKRALYASHGVVYYWIVDPVARTIEAHTLQGGGYELAARLAGDTPSALPPFLDLAIDPAALWA
jgi:Uma2 family endonuclease